MSRKNQTSHLPIIESFINKFAFNQIEKKKVRGTKKETFRTREKVKDENKIKVNKILSKLGKENIQKAVILDAETMTTTKYLKKVGYDVDNIIIPNPIVFDRMQKKHKRVYNMYLGDLLDKYKGYLKGRVSLLFGDYCCSYDGNKDVKPSNDLKKVFKYKLLTHNSILAVTFSYRGKRDSKVRCKTFLRLTAKQYGYHIKPIWETSYTGMFVIIFRVFRPKK